MYSTTQLKNKYKTCLKNCLRCRFVLLINPTFLYFCLELKSDMWHLKFQIWINKTPTDSGITTWKVRGWPWIHYCYIYHSQGRRNYQFICNVFVSLRARSRPSTVLYSFMYLFMSMFLFRIWMHKMTDFIVPIPAGTSSAGFLICILFKLNSAQHDFPNLSSNFWDKLSAA